MLAVKAWVLEGWLPDLKACVLGAWVLAVKKACVLGAWVLVEAVLGTGRLFKKYIIGGGS